MLFVGKMAPSQSGLTTTVIVAIVVAVVVVAAIVVVIIVVVVLIRRSRNRLAKFQIITIIILQAGRRLGWRCHAALPVVCGEVANHAGELLHVGKFFANSGRM